MKAVIVAGVLAAATAAAAQPAPGPIGAFASRGTVVVSADRLMPLFAYTKDSTDVGNNDTSSSSETSISLFSYGSPSQTIAYNIPRISLDYAIAPNITLGGSVIFFADLSASTSTTVGGTTSSADNAKATAFGLAPRIGYVLPLGPRLAIWPRGGFSYYTESISNPPNGGNTTSDGFHQWSLDLEAQFVMALAPHFFLQLGPAIDIPLSGAVSSTNGGTTVSDDNSQLHIGITGGLGGFF
ncbi:MAG TPA: hypothetical protein VGF94_25990 [Kofleriaceae bacterium]